MFLRMRFFGWLLAVVHLLGGFGSVQAGEPHPSLPPPVIPDCLGVNIHFIEPQPGELEMLAAAGFKWIRTDLSWAGTERKPGEYDFSAYDRLVAALDKFKIRAVFILDYGNPLYADAGDQSPFTSRVTTAEFQAAFGRWAVAAMRHFKGRGFLWEMWNEPNNPGFWKPKPDVQQYIALARSTGQALRAADLIGPKGEAFIGPATSTIDFPFLEACFRAGLLQFWDGVSVHPYRRQLPETVQEDYRTLRLLIRRYAPPGKTIPVISGEWGYSDASQNGPIGTDVIDTQFLTNIANDVALSIWYDWRDDGNDPKNPEHHFGVVENESSGNPQQPFKPKEAYWDVWKLTEQLSGYRFNKRLYVSSVNPSHSRAIWLLLFSRQPTEQKLVLWSHGTGPQYEDDVLVPVSRGLFCVNCYYYELDSVHETAGENGIRIDAWAYGVKYLTPEKPNDFLQVAAAGPRLPLEYVYRWPEPSSEQDSNGLHFTVKNPLNRPIKLSSFLVPIDPGAFFETRLNVSSARDQRGRFSQHEMIDLGDRQVLDYWQETTLVCTNPVQLEAVSMNETMLGARVLNPSGDPGSLTIYADGSQRVVVNFKTGEREKLVPLAFGEKFDRPRAVRLVALQDFPGQTSFENQILSQDLGQWLSLPPISFAELKAFADGDAKTSATFHLEATEAAPLGSSGSSIKLTYHFDAGWKFIGTNAPLPSISTVSLDVNALTGWPKQFGLWVYGDGQGCQMRIRFKDAAGQMFQSDGPKIDFAGWRFVKFPMTTSEDEPLAHWHGEPYNDGEIHYPITWDSMLLLDNISRQPISGEILFRSPTLIY